MGKIIDRLAERGTLVSDGAWGTFIHAKGLGQDECPESWNLSHADDIYDVAKSYVDAGADMILTNSFGGTSFKLAPYGFEDKVYEINKAAAEISKRAAGDDVFVLGSVGPTGKMLMMGEVTEDELIAAFSDQIKGLVDGGADAIIIETMSDVDEACAAYRAARAVCDKEVICTFTYNLTPANEYRTMMGASPKEVTELMVIHKADIMGANCGNGTAGMIEIVKEIRSVNSDIPILIHANAGMPELKDGVSVFPESADDMSCQIPDLLAAGANIVGGCCGTTPEHIKKIVEVMGS